MESVVATNGQALEGAEGTERTEPARKNTMKAILQSSAYGSPQKLEFRDVDLPVLTTSSC